MMEHFYQSLPGYFTFEGFYRRLAQSHLQSGMRAVEVGCFAGRSLAFLAVELLNASKAVELHGVDWGRQTPISALETNLRGLARVHESVSWDGAALFEDGSCDFVFLDAGHDYEDVRKDIEAWRPKVKAGGMLAGHDFTPAFSGVIAAVTEALPAYHVDRGETYSDGQFYPVWWVTT